MVTMALLSTSSLAAELSFWTDVRAFLANHHLNLLAVLFLLYVFPAITRFVLMRLRALPPGSAWDVRIRRLMKWTLDTTSYDDAEKKILEAEREVTVVIFPDLTTKVTVGSEPPPKVAASESKSASEPPSK